MSEPDPMPREVVVPALDRLVLDADGQDALRSHLDGTWFSRLRRRPEVRDVEGTLVLDERGRHTSHRPVLETLLAPRGHIVLEMRDLPADGSPGSSRTTQLWLHESGAVMSRRIGDDRLEYTAVPGAGLPHVLVDVLELEPAASHLEPCEVVMPTGAAEGVLGGDPSVDRAGAWSALVDAVREVLPGAADHLASGRGAAGGLRIEYHGATGMQEWTLSLVRGPGFLLVDATEPSLTPPQQLIWRSSSSWDLLVLLVGLLPDAETVAAWSRAPR